MEYIVTILFGGAFAIFYRVALWSMAAFIVVVVAYICLVLLGYADIRPLLLVITAFH